MKVNMDDLLLAGLLDNDDELLSLLLLFYCHKFVPAPMCPLLNRVST